MSQQQTSLKLTAHGVYTAKDFNVIKNDGSLSSPGVYIWGTNNNKGSAFTPLYVGMHENDILHRVQEHFLNLHFGNKYPIYTDAFYDDLIKGIRLIPKISHIDRIKDQTHPLYKDFKRFLDDRIFTCESGFIASLLANKKTPYNNILSQIKGNCITSQGYDLLVGSSSKPIQKTIEKYFSEERFAFVLIPVTDPEKNKHIPPINKIEGNIKMALKGGTLSRSNGFDKNILIDLGTKSKQSPPSHKGKMKIKIDDYFLLDNNNHLTA